MAGYDELPTVLAIKEVRFKEGGLRADLLSESANGIAVGKLILEVPALFAETVRPGDYIGAVFRRLTDQETALLHTKIIALGG